MRHALVGPSDEIIKTAERVDPTVDTKPGYRWLPFPKPVRPSYNRKTEALVNDGLTVSADQVVQTYSVRNKTAQEIDDDKETALESALDSGKYGALAQVILQLENDNRDIKAKINELAPGTFPKARAQQITMRQLKDGLKALLT